MDYQLIRSDRRSINIRIDRDANIIVRAPYFTSVQRIESFVSENEKWILATQAKVREQAKAEAAGPPRFTAEELKVLKERGKKEFPPLLSYYAKIVGASPSRFIVRCQRTRWGSCTAKGRISLNCLLLLTPDEVRDSVIVHELCHLKQLNHSKAFYAEVEKAFPEYKKADRWLKENGP